MFGMRNGLMQMTVAASLALCGCGKEAGTKETRKPQEPAGGAHEHGHDDAARRDLGSAMIGPFEVEVAVYGTLTPGEESDVDIHAAAAEVRPTAIRAWIGSEDGRGSLRARAEQESDHYHAHVEAPDPIADDARLWIEIEWAADQRATGSFDPGQ